MQRVGLCIVFTIITVSSALATPPSVRVYCESVSASEQRLNIQTGDFDLDGIQIDGSIWYLPTLSGYPFFLEKGSPQLPLVSRNVIIPDTGKVYVRVAVKEYQDYPETPIAPSKGALPRTIDPAMVPYTFGSVYKDDYWPASIATAGSPYILRDYRGVNIRICPFRYYPQQRLLRVYTRLQIEVITRGDVGLNAIERTAPAPQKGGRFNAVYASRFMNYGSKEMNLRYTPLADTNDHMLIIAADPLTSSIQPLADWKNQRGIQTVVAPLSAVGSTTASIKNYIQSYYDTNGLTFLLIVGDAEDVPSPIASTGSSDPSYSKLAGSDNYPDIFVGRFSGSTSQQISTMVERTIAYEKNATTSDSWYNLATGIASDEGSGPSDIEHMNAIRTALLANGYASVDQIHDPGASASQVANAIYAGRGLINYVGHGDVKEWVTTTFDNSDINSLTNNIHWPFIFDVACVNGQFTGDTCFAEAWIRAEHNSSPAGALAIYSSTINQEWEPPMTAQNEFNALLTTSDIHAYGALCFNAAMKMMDDWGTDGVNMFNTWTVFGDPSVIVRTATPTTMNIVHGVANLNSYTVHVEGVEGALAALSVSNSLIGSAYTDSNGKATIPVNDWLTGTPLLTVTAFNTVTYTAAVITSTAQLDVSPSTISNSVSQDAFHTSSLTISNSDTAGSLLTYTTEIRPVYSSSRPRCSTACEVESLREMTGSEVFITPATYGIGSNLNLAITLTNRSPDEEWVEQISIALPTDCTVTGGQNINGLDGGELTYNGTTGSGVTINWTAASGNEIIAGGTGGLQMQISPSAATNLYLSWSVTGDGWGDAPHTVTGVVELTALAPAMPSLELITPAGGEVWMLGATQSITWNSINYTQRITVLRSTDDGSSWSTVASDLTDSGAYSWTIDGNQSDQCRIAIQSPDETITSTNADTFSIYEPLDWIILDQTSGTVTNGASQLISMTLSATGKVAGTYSALLSVISSCGATNIPITMFVTDSGWTLDASAGANGSMIPSGNIVLANGTSTSFVISASGGYYISSVMTNGTVVPGCAGLTCLTSRWSNVRASGNISATFASIETATATNGTPVPWLREFYTTEPTLEALEQQAELDTDGDGLLGWQEYIVMSDPTNAASAFYTRFETSSSPGLDILQWQAVTGRTYSIYHSSNLTEGFQLMTGGITVQSNTECSYTNSTSQDVIFYWLKVEQ